MNRPKLIEVRKDVNNDSPMGRLIDALLEDDPKEAPAPAKSPKFFVPEIGERYWCIHPLMGVQWHTNNSKKDEIASSLGAYRTKEECEQAFEKQKALVRLWQAADKDFYFRPDWESENQTKYALKYDHQTKTWGPDTWRFTQGNFSLPYFATKEDAEKFITENAKDLEIYRVN